MEVNTSESIASNTCNNNNRYSYLHKDQHLRNLIWIQAQLGPTNTEGQPQYRKHLKQYSEYRRYNVKNEEPRKVTTNKARGVQ